MMNRDNRRNERTISRFLGWSQRLADEMRTLLNHRENLDAEVRELQNEVEALQTQLEGLREQVEQAQDEINHFDEVVNQEGYNSSDG